MQTRKLIALQANEKEQRLFSAVHEQMGEETASDTLRKLIKDYAKSHKIRMAEA